MDKKHIFTAFFVGNLTDAFKESLTFYIAYGTADFADDHIRCRFSGGGFLLSQSIDACLDFLGDVRNDLNGGTQIIAAALSGKYIPVDFAGADAAAACQIFIDETLVMAQVKVGFRSVVGDKNLSVLIRAHGSRIYVEIRVKFLEQHPQTSLLEQPAQRCSAYSLSKSGDYTSCDKDVFCHCFYLPFPCILLIFHMFAYVSNLKNKKAPFLFTLI